MRTVERKPGPVGLCSADPLFTRLRCKTWYATNIWSTGGTGRMVVSPKKHQKADLEKIANQLASIHILIVPGNERHFIRATAKFATRSFAAGAYRVSVGLKQAILHLDLPSYD